MAVIPQFRAPIVLQPDQSSPLAVAGMSFLQGLLDIKVMQEQTKQKLVLGAFQQQQNQQAIQQELQARQVIAQQNMQFQTQQQLDYVRQKWALEDNAIKDSTLLTDEEKALALKANFTKRFGIVKEGQELDQPPQPPQDLLPTSALSLTPKDIEKAMLYVLNTDEFKEKVKNAPPELAHAMLLNEAAKYLNTQNEIAQQVQAMAAGKPGPAQVYEEKAKAAGQRALEEAEGIKQTQDAVREYLMGTDTVFGEHAVPWFQSGSLRKKVTPRTFKDLTEDEQAAAVTKAILEQPESAEGLRAKKYGKAAQPQEQGRTEPQAEFTRRPSPLQAQGKSQTQQTPKFSPEQIERLKVQARLGNLRAQEYLKAMGETWQ